MTTHHHYISLPDAFLHADVLIQVQNPRSGALAKTFPSSGDMDDLSSKCSKLSSFKANVLRTTTFGNVEWERKDSKWTGGVKEGKGLEIAS